MESNLPSGEIDADDDTAIFMSVRREMAMEERQQREEPHMEEKEERAEEEEKVEEEPFVCDHIAALVATEVREVLAGAKRACRSFAVAECAEMYHEIPKNKKNKAPAECVWGCFGCKDKFYCTVKFEKKEHLRKHVDQSSHRLFYNVFKRGITCVECKCRVTLDEPNTRKKLTEIAEVFEDFARMEAPIQIVEKTPTPASVSRGGKKKGGKGSKGGKGVTAAQIHKMVVAKNAVVAEPKKAFALPTDPVKMSFDKCIRGLRNLGNTCFFNSIVQNLSHCRPFVEAFLGIPSPVEAGVIRWEKPVYEFKAGSVTSGMQTVLSEMYFPVSTGPINPQPLFSAIGKKLDVFTGYRQHDAQELLMGLLNLISEEQTGVGLTKKFSPIEDIFEGQTINTVTCHVCGTVSTVHEKFFNVSVPLPQQNVTKANKRAMSKTHDDDDDDNWSRAGSKKRMSKADRKKQKKEKKKAAKKSKKGKNKDKNYEEEEEDVDEEYGLEAENEELDVYAEEPYVEEVEHDKRPEAAADVANDSSLLGCLTRFTDMETLCGANRYMCAKCTEIARTKDPKASPVYTEATKQVTLDVLPKVLIVHLNRYRNTGRRMEKNSCPITFPEVLDVAPFCVGDEKPRNTVYELFGLSEHCGSLVGGHYTAAVKTGSAWYDCSDTSVGTTTIESVLSKRSGTYILFYIQREPVTPSVVESP